MLKARQLTFISLVPYCLPIFLGLVLGYLSSTGEWVYALGLALTVPLAILFSSRPFVGVILWLLLMPLSSALPNPELMYWVIHRGLIPFTLCLSFLPYLLNSSRKPYFKIGIPEVCIALFVVYVPISVILSGSGMRQPLIRYADRMLIPFCMYLIMRLNVVRSSEKQFFQWAVLFLAVSQSLIGFIGVFAPYYLPYAWRPLLNGYASGSLLNPNVFVVVLGFCICLLFQSAMNKKSGIVKYIFIVTCGVSVFGIFLSMERAAWIAGFLLLVGLFWLNPKIMLRFALITAILSLTLGEVFFSKYSSRIIDRISNQGTIDDRIVVTDAMFQMIINKPLFGWGYESLNNNIDDYYRQVGAASANIRKTTSHNTYLTIFAELGFVGILLYMLPLIWLFKTSLHLLRKLSSINPKRWSMLIALWLGVLQSFIVSNFMDMRFFPIGLTLWWMNLGLIANMMNQDLEALERSTPFLTAQKGSQIQPFTQFLQENNGPK